MPPLRSMTGFGAARAEGKGVSVGVEVKGVNNRGLKIVVKSRPSLGVREKDVRDRVAAALSRGSIEVYVSMQRAQSAVLPEEVLENARVRIGAVRAIAAALDLADDLTARDLLGMPGLLADNGDVTAGPADAEWQVIENALDAALRQALEMREAEGAALAEVLERLARPVEAFRAGASAVAPRVVERARERLQARLKEWFPNGQTPGDSQALEREIALFADRSDIREELDRLASHLERYRAALAEGRGAGKRLEFLAQELLREVNTASTKLQDPETSELAVSAKLAIEQIKEQAANVE